MAIEKKIFAGGGMDMDTDERFMPKTDYKKAVNCRISKTDEGNDGIVENIRSNALTNNNLIKVGDKCIGTYEDKSTATVIFFIYALDGNHGIYRKTNTGSIQKILQDPILNFNQRYLITGINVIGSDEDKFPEGLLYWTDDYNPPRKINIEKARTNSYTAITDSVLDVIKWAPDIHCIVKPYLTDTNIESNQLKSKAWQFKHRWIYDDGEKSSWSPISPVAHDNSFDSFFNSGTQSFLNNVIPVGFLPGQDTVSRIQIAARNTNGIDDFLLIADIDKSNVKEKVGGGGNSLPGSFVTSLVGTTPGSYQYFYFYNDGIYSSIDVVESSKLYNDVPHLAKAQEIVDGNRLVYGNVVSGQTGLDESRIELTPQHPALTSLDNLTSVIGLDARWNTRVKWDGPAPQSGSHKRRFTNLRVRIQWKVVAPSGNLCSASYNINMKDFKYYKYKVRDAALFSGSDREVQFGVFNISYQSAVFTGAQTANQIATSIVSDIQGTTAWDLKQIGGTVSNGTNHTGVSENWTVSGDYIQYELLTNDARKTWFHAQGTIAGVVAQKWVNILQYIHGSTSSVWGTTSSWESSGVAKAELRRKGVFWSALPPPFTPIWHDDTNVAGHAGFFSLSSNGFNMASNGSTVTVASKGVYDTGWRYEQCILTVTSAADKTFLSTVYANTTAAGDYSDYEELCPSGASMPSISSFKTGASHRFGLVYYDKGNRSTSVQLSTISDVYIPKTSESGYTGEHYINWQILHTPPDWATHYQWVYGGNTLTDKFLQFVTNGFYDGTHADKYVAQSTSAIPALETYGNNILVDISNIRQYQESESSEVVKYDFQYGDVLRLVLDENDLPSSDTWEFKILGITGERDMPSVDDASGLVTTRNEREFLVLARESALIPLIDSTATIIPALADYTLEIYSPKSVSDEDQIIYYEFSNFGNCPSDGNGGKLHGSVIGDATSVSQTMGAPATGRFTRGDVFYKYRNSKSLKGFTPVESFHYNDRFKSDYWDKGRPNALLEDFKRTRKHSTCLYSESYIPNTNINGLSSFFPDVSFQEFERDYNSIQKLHSKDNKLIIFQEDKVSQSLVSRNIIYNIDGSGNVATSDSVLSQAVPYLGNYGINKNPESFAVYGNSMYFVDIQRGVVLRLANDGFTPISNYKMKNFFTDSFKAIQSLTGDNFHKFVGVYDSAFDEYVISQPGYWSYLAIIGKNGGITYVKDKHLIEAYTLGFCESSNRWNSFYSYIPEMMCAFQNGFVSFDAGNLYTHNISGKYVDSKGILKTHNTYNEFYGIEYDSELWVVSNEAASNNKVYQSFSQESDNIWDVTFDSPNGQSTVLLPSDFDTRENIHYSDIMNDVNSAGGLIEGDRIRDVTLLAKLKLFSNKLTRIFGVNFNFAPSQRSNK